MPKREIRGIYGATEFGPDMGNGAKVVFMRMGDENCLNIFLIIF